MAEENFGLGHFLNKLKETAVRTTNMFEMVVTSQYDDVNDLIGNITMFGQGFELPNRTLEFADVSFKGYPVPVPTLTKMGNEHSITVNADVDGKLRNGFLRWQAHTSDATVAIENHFQGDRGFANYEKDVIKIFLLDKNMERTNGELISIYGVRISEVGTEQVSNTEASVATFTVNFRSIYWESDFDK